MGGLPERAEPSGRGGCWEPARTALSPAGEGGRRSLAFSPEGSAGLCQGLVPARPAAGMRGCTQPGGSLGRGSSLMAGPVTGAPGRGPRRKTGSRSVLPVTVGTRSALPPPAAWMEGRGLAAGAPWVRVRPWSAPAPVTRAPHVLQNKPQRSCPGGRGGSWGDGGEGTTGVPRPVTEGTEAPRARQ